jgi:PAS domain S-box-containing protein
VPELGVEGFFIAAPCGLSILDSELRYLQVNETLARMNGATIAHHLGRTIDEVVPAFAPVVAPLMRRVLSTGEPILNVEVRLETAGSPHAWQYRIVTFFPLRTAAGLPCGIGTVEVDVTPRRQTEEKLAQTVTHERRLEKELLRLLESTAEGIFGLDVEGRCTFINRASAAMLGFDPAEMVGQNVHALIHHSRADGSPYPVDECPIIRTLRTGEGCRLNDEVLWRRDQTSFSVEFSAHPIVEDERVQGAVVTFIDVTTRKRAEEALRTRVRQQEAVAKLGFLALQSLDLETVMTESAALTRQGLGVEYCKVLELLPDGDTLLLRAGAGWKSGLVGRATEPTGLGSHGGYTLKSTVPVIVDDLRRETRFQPPPLLTDAGVVSGVDVIIHGKEQPLGILGAHTVQHRSFTDEDIHFLQSVANVMGSAIESRRATESQQALSRRLVDVQESVQRAIARELHDEIGQILTALRLVLEMASRQQPGDAGARLREARGLVNDLQGKVRDLSRQLRPAVLDDLGLLPAFVLHTEHYTVQTNVRIALTHTGIEARRFPPAVETAAYRIVQEALTNVARHAAVQDAAVRVWASEEILGVEIKDAGVGFDPKAAFASPRSSGLVGMRERAALLGGHLSVESTPGAGTRVIAELPLQGPVTEKTGGPNGHHHRPGG